MFARVSPQQKQQIVETLKNSGHLVAVTGDGVNDAPALKMANIGVAMGYGTDVAKETASIIITDNNFASIIAGIEKGRYTYSNLRKIIYPLISTGAAEILLVALALLFGMPIASLPIQLRWLNLVTNGIQDVSLAFEKGERKLMTQPPRNPNESIFNPQKIGQTLLAAAVMTFVTFGLWFHLLNKPPLQSRLIYTSVSKNRVKTHAAFLDSPKFCNLAGLIPDQSLTWTAQTYHLVSLQGFLTAARETI